MIILLLIYIGVAILLAELAAYCWHRYLAHSDEIVDFVHRQHGIHHRLQVLTDENNSALEDFIWILFFLIILEICLGVAMLSTLLDKNAALAITFTVLTVFTWNYWIHQAYHQPNHWLNQFEWFQKEKLRHFMHHWQPTKNYGIASHFVDHLASTYLDPCGQLSK